MAGTANSTVQVARGSLVPRTTVRKVTPGCRTRVVPLAVTADEPVCSDRPILPGAAAALTVALVSVAAAMAAMTTRESLGTST